MQCDVCAKKKATVHLTEIVDDQMTELHLCEDCAREKSVQMEQQFGLADLLAGLTDFSKQPKTVEKIKLSCTNCSLSYEDFRKFGRLGCSECYTSFGEHLNVLLKKIHGSGKHYGKAPVKMSKAIEKTVTGLQQLKDQLRQMIEMENFEEAAKIRDQIRQLENKQNNQKE
ncbi:MAG: UvrB/UvrC motif-containing protein [Candidatus Omnitrophota bacterium]